MMLPKRITYRWLRSLPIEELREVERILRKRCCMFATDVNSKRWHRADDVLHENEAWKPWEPGNP
jgi:hypothetical protein